MLDTKMLQKHDLQLHHTVHDSNSSYIATYTYVDQLERLHFMKVQPTV